MAGSQPDTDAAVRRSSDTGSFDGATYTEYFNAASATPLIN
jgi:hypothetical protein